MKLLTKSAKNIEAITGMSIDIIKGVSFRSLEFYFQNARKISIENKKREFYFEIKNRRLKRKINKALFRDKKDRKDSFSDGEMGEYFFKINYLGFPIEKNYRMNYRPIKL